MITSECEAFEKMGDVLAECSDDVLADIYDKTDLRLTGGFRARAKSLAAVRVLTSRALERLRTS